MVDPAPAKSSNPFPVPIDDNETQEWTEDMQDALEHVSEAIGNESWDYTSSLIVQYEAQYPGFAARAQELVDVYRELNPPSTKKSGGGTFWDALAIICITAGLAWGAWLIYLYESAKVGK